MDIKNVSIYNPSCKFRDSNTNTISNKLHYYSDILDGIDSKSESAYYIYSIRHQPMYELTAFVRSKRQYCCNYQYIKSVKIYEICDKYYYDIKGITEELYRAKTVHCNAHFDGINIVWCKPIIREEGNI